MSTTTDRQEPGQTPLELVNLEIETARKELRPTSRRALALMVRRETGLQFRDAFDLVDSYCNEKHPAIPAYLSSEFVVYWLKAVAVANILIGIAAAWYGGRLHSQDKLAWPAFCLATVFCGLGAMSWVKSIEKESGIGR